MLALSRKVGQQVKIGDDVTLTILEVKPNRVVVGLDAPRATTRIVRAELLTALDTPNTFGVQDSPAQTP